MSGLSLLAAFVGRPLRAAGLRLLSLTVAGLVLADPFWCTPSASACRVGRAPASCCWPGRSPTGYPGRGRFGSRWPSRPRPRSGSPPWPCRRSATSRWPPCRPTWRPRRRPLRSRSGGSDQVWPEASLGGDAAAGGPGHPPPVPHRGAGGAGSGWWRTSRPAARVPSAPGRPRPWWAPASWCPGGQAPRAPGVGARGARSARSDRFQAKEMVEARRPARRQGGGAIVRSSSTAALARRADEGHVPLHLDDDQRTIWRVDAKPGEQAKQEEAAQFDTMVARAAPVPGSRAGRPCGRSPPHRRRASGSRGRP